MKSLVFKEVLRPLLLRYGTLLGGYLVGAVQADPSMIDQVAAVVLAAGLVTADLVFSAVIRSRERADLVARLTSDNGGAE